MNNTRAGYAKYATLVTLTLGLTLSACAAPSQSAAQPGRPEVSATETAAPAASPAASAVEATSEPVLTLATEKDATVLPAPVVPAPAKPARVGPARVLPAPVAPAVPAAVAPAPAAPAPAADVVAPALKTFTFPDGHISFDLPSSWTVKTEQGPYLDYGDETDKAQSVEAHIYDASGNEVAVVASGGYGGGAGGPVSRTILDAQAIPAFPNANGSSHFAFVMDNYPFEEPTRYYMAVLDKLFLTEGEKSISAISLIRSGNGYSSAEVIFGTPAFASPAAATAWMGTSQYSQLKGMLSSLRYA